MKTFSTLHLLLLLVLAGPSASAQPPAPGDFQSSFESPLRAQATNTAKFPQQRIDGMLPTPWSDDSSWCDLDVEYEHTVELPAHSGTPLFVSLQPEALGPGQEAVLREALDIASRPLPMAEPLDWMTNTTPKDWRCHDGIHRFRWNGFPGEDFSTDVILYQ